MAYFSNGGAGAWLDAQCEQCPIGKLACPTHLAHDLYNYDQLKDGQENLKSVLDLLVDEDGCKTFRLLKEARFAPVKQEEQKAAVPAEWHMLPSALQWAKERGIA
jgi:hypothetical protein